MRTQRERREKILIYVKRALIKMSGQSEEKKQQSRNWGSVIGPQLVLPLDQTQPRKSQLNDSARATPVFSLLHKPPLPLNYYQYSIKGILDEPCLNSKPHFSVD